MIVARCTSGPYQAVNGTTSCGAMGKSYPGGNVQYVLSGDFGASWSDPTMLLAFNESGVVGKMTANLMLETFNGSWILPVWREGHTQYDLVPDASAVLISNDRGDTWTVYGNITNPDTWLIENTIAETQSGRCAISICIHTPTHSWHRLALPVVSHDGWVSVRQLVV